MLDRRMVLSHLIFLVPPTNRTTSISAVENRVSTSIPRLVNCLIRLRLKELGPPMPWLDPGMQTFKTPPYGKFVGFNKTAC